jgi:hypothetical protein
MAPTKIWCLVIDQHNRPSGSSFQVPSKNNIAHLKKEVKAEKPNTLRDVDADELVVWRCKDPSTVINRQNMEDQVRRLFSEAGVKKINEGTTLASLKVLPNERLLVQMPSAFALSSFNRAILSYQLYRT